MIDNDNPQHRPEDGAGDGGLSSVPLPEQPPMDTAAGGPQAEDVDAAVTDTDPEASHTPVTD